MRRLVTTLALAVNLGAAGCGPDEAPPAPTASPAAEETRDASVESFDGVPIAYSVGGAGEGAVVLIHGWSCDRGYWEAQVEDLRRDYRVVTVDLAGHGDSGTARTVWSIDAFGKDVAAVVDDLDIRSVVLVGHSMGGFVALEAARHLPGRVVGVIGVDTLHDVEARMPDEQWNEILGGLERDFDLACKAFVGRLFVSASDPELVREIVADMCSAPPEVAIASLRAARAYDTALGVDAAQVRLRCINGTGFPTNVETNRKHAADFEVYPIEGTGHYPMLERPVEFNRLLRLAIEDLTG